MTQGFPTAVYGQATEEADLLRTSPFLLILAHYFIILPPTAYAFYSVLFLCSTEKQFRKQRPFPNGSYIAPHSQIQHSFPFLATETEPEGL